MSIFRRIVYTCYTCSLIVVVGCSGAGIRSVPNPQALESSQQGITSSSLSPQALALSGELDRLPIRTVADAGASAYAEELVAENPEFAGLRVVQLADTWHETELLPPVFTQPDAGLSFPCSPSGPYSRNWNGTAPPNCDQGSNIGPFRGVFSVPGKAAAQGFITLPESKSTMPTNGKPPGQGFVYMEAWASPGADNVEGGFQYNAGSDTYTPYVSGPFTLIPGYTIYPRTDVTVWEGAIFNYNHDVVTYGPQAGLLCSDPKVGGCAGTFFAYPVPNRLFVDFVRIAARGMQPNNGICCIFRRMTSIGLNTGQMFVGKNPPAGVPPQWSFGPVVWSRSFTEHHINATPPSPTPSSTPNDDISDGNGTSSGWKLGVSSDLGGDPPGYNNFPNCPDNTYITTQYQNAQIETDTISVPPYSKTTC